MKLAGRRRRRDALYPNVEGTKMARLIAAALFVVAAAAPALACEWNKSAATDQSTVASQAQQSKPVHQHNRS
ncbi:MAG TPA: hypothetical protein VGD41_08065 [Pyrinomonadaceae bacterium]